MNHDTSLVVAIGIAMLVLWLYFLPAIIGGKRNVSSTGMLWFLNLLFGWTIIGWAVLLIWAVAGQSRHADAYYRRAALTEASK